ncbi:ABC transporter ATP-binding protein [Microbacterium sp.]|uniref:ABC transporter ATP-binding protein n=1 Tax=Microbacterium sp. TaxID=51671 RepID=UPI0039E277AA
MTTSTISPRPVTATTAGSVRLVDVSKAYNAKHSDQKAVDTINLDIEAGTFVTLLGPSGCGKTTTLRMIAGFEHPTEGDILLDDASVLGVTPDKRPMSMVFQSYALFPHLTVRDNVAFGLKLKKLDRQVRQQKVADGLRMMGIEQYADRYPHQLSGGQQQRVALARALVMEPKIVLFDEPLSNLDARLRVRMRDEIRALQQRLGLTAIFVTHDQSEALTMSDVIVVMSAGRIEQVGSPTEIYRHPANRFVAAFLGTSNFVDGTVSAILGGEGAYPLYRVHTDLGTFDVPGTPGLTAGSAASLVIRAENLHVTAPGDEAISATVRSVAFDGGVVNYVVGSQVGELQGQAPGAAPLYPRGTQVALTIEPGSLWVIPRTEDVH